MDLSTWDPILDMMHGARGVDVELGVFNQDAQPKSVFTCKDASAAVHYPGV